LSLDHLLARRRKSTAPQPEHRRNRE
jgi:hypothetical protein